MDQRIAALLARPDVAAARAWITERDGATLALQCALTEVPAPTFDEAARGRAVAERMRAIGLAGVATDAAGNVLGRYGKGSGAGVVLASHLDTVFEDPQVSVRTAGERLLAPGIGDNGRGLAALLTLAEACVVCRVRAPVPVTFVATVGEEGLGDLRGVKHLFADPAFRPHAFIALDGPGHTRIVNRALGIRRHRVTWRGPGGHSWAAFGVANPALALAHAAAAMAELPLPAEPRAALTVARLGGGAGINSIPVEAWLEVDIRAEDAGALAALDAAALAACTRASETVNRRRAAGTAPLTMDVAALGARPSGATPETAPLVQAALAATRALGFAPQLASASTDANVPMERGIPAIALGAGGRGGDAHLASEWYENAAGPEGVVRALLVALAAMETGDGRR